MTEELGAMFNMILKISSFHNMLISIVYNDLIFNHSQREPYIIMIIWLMLKTYVDVFDKNLFKLKTMPAMCAMI